MKQLILLSILSLVSAISIAEPELKGSPQDLRGFLYPTDKIVTIHAQADEKAYSDKAIVSLVITTEDKLLSNAIAENSSLRETITRALVASGVAASAVKSSKFSSSPQFGWFGSKPSSFKVVNRMAIAITDEAHLKEIAGVADQYQEAELSDTSFEHTQKDQYNEKVKAEALEKILRQKEFYEKSLGVKLTPIGIRDSNIRQRATRGAMFLEEVLVTAAKIDKKAEYSSSPAYKDQSGESSFDEIKYEADIAVDFKIEN